MGRVAEREEQELERPRKGKILYTLHQPWQRHTCRFKFKGCLPFEADLLSMRTLIYIYLLLPKMRRLMDLPATDDLEWTRHDRWTALMEVANHIKDYI